MANIFALTQHAYRFYEDGAETTAVAIDVQNTPITRLVLANSVVLLRVGMNESGAGNVAGATTDDYQLQLDVAGGGFGNVTGASTGVRGFASANLTDAGAATQQLTGGTGTFSGKVSEDGLLDNHQVAGNGCAEFLYALEFVAADLAEGNAITFRVLLNGATTNMTYTVTPTINITKVAFKVRSNKVANQAVPRASIY